MPNPNKERRRTAGWIATMSCSLMLAPIQVGGQDPRIEPSAVPGLIVSVAAAARLDPGSLAKIEQQGQFGALLARLSAALDRLACDCLTRLAFNEASYIGRPDAADAMIWSGERRTAASNQRTPRSELVVLEAIDAGGETAMIVSSVSPRRVSIVGVDAALGARLIYDTLADAKDQTGRAKEAMFAVAAVTVRSRGVVEVVEHRDGDAEDRERVLVLAMKGPRISMTWESRAVRKSR